ncbi:MAG: RNA polymerase sigma factor [Bacteroidota bacterium]
MRQTLTDQQAMQAVKEGSMQELGTLYQRYRPILFSFFYNLYRNPEVCDDLIQNVFERVLKYKSRYREEGSFKPWLFSIARNVSHDYYKKTKSRKEVQVESWEELPLLTVGKDKKIEQEEELTLLRIALNKLDLEKKEILIMSKLKGLPYKEIGESLGCTEGAVKVKVYRALKALQKTYQEIIQSA